MDTLGISDTRRAKPGREASRSQNAISANPRAAQTRAKLIEAVTQLADEALAREVDSRLTPAQIGRKAKVSTSSFYAHYDSVSALMLAALKSHLNDLVVDTLSQLGESTDSLSAGDTRAALEDVLTQLDRFAGLIVSARSVIARDEQITEVFRESVAATIRRRSPQISSQEHLMTSTFIAGGILSAYAAFPGKEERDRLLTVLEAVIPIQVTAATDTAKLGRAAGLPANGTRKE